MRWGKGERRREEGWFYMIPGCLNEVCCSDEHKTCVLWNAVNCGIGQLAVAAWGRLF